MGAEASKPLVLCVDDEPDVLEGIKLNLRRKFELITATSGAEGLQLIEEFGPPAVVVSDMRIPQMNGAEFLTRVREVSPDSVRMLLTGYSDKENTVAAVNEGGIFRYLAKPCPASELVQAIRDGVAHHELKATRKVLLEQTLLGSVTAMMDMMSITNPIVFGQATRIRRLCRKLAEAATLDEAWKLEVASLMSRMGWVTLPSDLAHKLTRGASNLSRAETESVERANLLSEKLVRRIPKLDDVAEVIRGAESPWAELTRQELSAQSVEVATMAQMLRAVIAYDAIAASGSTASSALKTMREMEGQYDPLILDLLTDQLVKAEQEEVSIEVSLAQLEPGMRLEQDIVLANGSLLAVKGYEITVSFMDRLMNFRGVLESDRFLVFDTKSDS